MCLSYSGLPVEQACVSGRWMDVLTVGFLWGPLERVLNVISLVQVS